MSSRTPITLSELCDDVILLIIDRLKEDLSEDESPLKQLSLTSHRFRDLVIRPLFKTIEINQPVSQLTSTTLIESYAQICRLNIFGSKWWWCSGSYVSSKDALDLFRCLSGLHNLKSLEVCMMSRSIDIFESAFKENADEGIGMFMLPQVEELSATTSAAFLTSHCPNLKSLLIVADRDCLQRYIGAKQRILSIHPELKLGTHKWPALVSCDITSAWDFGEIEMLPEMFPTLRHLRLRSIGSYYCASTKAIIMAIGDGFKQLETLHLVKCDWICMSTFAIWRKRLRALSDEAYRRQMWLNNERRRVRAENDYARYAFESIPNLQEIWLGEYRVARRMAQEDGNKRIHWLWERKLEDACGFAVGIDQFLQWKTENDAVVVASEIGM